MDLRRQPGPRTALGILTGLNLLNYVDRFVPSAILPSIIAALSLTDAQAGSLQTLFILSYSLVSPLAGWLGDRRPRFQLAAVGVLIWSAATFGSGLAPTFAALVLARALTGIGEASYTVVTPSLLSDFFPPDRRGRALAIFYAAIPIGVALGYVLGGEIGHRYGWRAAFFVAGAPGAVIALALLFLRDPPRGAHDSVATALAAGSLRQSLAGVMARRSYVYNTVAQTLYTFGMGGLGAWMPTYFVRVRGLPLDKAARLFGIVLLAAGFVGTLIGGRFGDRLARRRADGHFLISGVTLAASLPFTLLAILAPSPAIFWPAMFLTLLLLFTNTGPLNAAMANVLPAHLRAWGFALNTMAIHLLGDALSPLLIGFTSDRIGLRLPVLLAGMVPVAGGAVLFAGRRTLIADLEAARA